MSLSEGAEVGGYRIDGVVGRGGMGVVYVATQLSLGRKVALKIVAPELASNPDFRERFKHESRVAASIEHAHVIPVYEADESGDLLFITMRYVGGTDLRELIGSQGRLEPRRAARIVSQVASALDAAHERGLVHRDVKPANVVMAQEGGQDHAFLTDFGLAKDVASQGGLTKSGMFVGTIDYVPPEQIEGRQLDARTDVYALGCVLYQALSGRIPFDKPSDVAKLFAHMNEPPPSLLEVAPELPPELAAVCSRAMAKNPEDRYPSAGDLGRAALAAAEGQTTSSAETSVAQGPAAPPTALAPAPAPDRTVIETASAPATTVGSAPPEGTVVGAAAPVPPPPPPPAPGRPPGNAGSRRPMLLVGAALAAVALLAVVLVVALGGGGDDDGDTDRAASPQGNPSSVTGGTAPAPPAQGSPADEQAIEQTLVTWFGGGDGAERCKVVSDEFLRNQNGQTGAAGEAACADYVGDREPREVSVESVEFKAPGAHATFTHDDTRQIAVMVKEGGAWVIDEFLTD